MERRWEVWQRAIVGLALAAVFALTFWVYSPPEPKFLGWFFMVAIWLLVGAVWLAWMVWIALQGGLKSRRTIFLVPGLVAVTAFLVLTDAPMETRFKLSEPSMTNAAEFIINHPKSANDRNRIGTYKSESVETQKGIVQFTVPELGFLDSIGFVYSRTGELPDAVEAQTYKRMNDHWWVWSQEF